MPVKHYLDTHFFVSVLWIKEVFLLDGHNKLNWAKDLKSEDYELLCPKGGKASIDKYEECNIAKVPRYMVRD